MLRCLRGFDVEEGGWPCAGVNPMITVEALAYLVAEGLAKDFKRQMGSSATPVHQMTAATQPEE